MNLLTFLALGVVTSVAILGYDRASQFYTAAVYTTGQLLGILP